MPGVRRGPWDRALRELVQLRLRGGLADNASFDEAVHRSQLLSRRGFLGGVGAAGLGLTVAGCTTNGPIDAPAAAPSGVDFKDGPRVVIVGAGLAGLTAAYRLGQAGVASQVYEARDRIGGRCWSSRDWNAGMVGEHGGEFIDTRHVHLQGLANELNLTIDDLWSNYEPGATSLTWVDGQLVKRKDLMAPLNEASLALTNVAKRNGTYLANQNPGPRAIAFDEMTVAEWFEDTMHESIDSPMGRVMASQYAGWYGLDPDELGASNVIDYFAVDWPGGDERYTIHGGNDQVPQGLADALPKGSVILESALESIRKTASGTYELGFSGSSEPVIADRLVLTLPYTVLRDVDIADAGFSSTKLDAINRLGMGTGSKVLLEFDKPFSDFNNWGSWGLYADHPQFDTWESNSTDSNQDRYSLLTVFGGGRDAANYPTEEPHGPAPTSVTDDTLKALNEMVPGLAAAHTGNSWLDFWTKDPWVHGSYAAFLPTNTTSFYGILGDAEGKAHFAGEHTSVYSQGFLNGGAESGSRVAAEVLDALGKPYPTGLKKAFADQRQYEPVFPWT